MRRQAVSLLVPLLLLAGYPAQAAPLGVITGRVENALTGRGEAGVQVLLFKTIEGEPKVSVTTTDRRGRYVFEGLETGPEHIYTLDARFDDGLFAGSAVSLPDDTEETPVVDTTLRVWPTTRTPDVIVIRRDDIFAILDGTHVGILESVTVVNTSDTAYIGRGEGRPGTSPTLGFPLPERGNNAVTIVESDLDIPAILDTDFGFAATTAIPPGTWKLTFTYQVEGAGGNFDLSRATLYPTLELSVYASEPLKAESNRLVDGPEEDIGGRFYSRYSSEERIDAGDPLQVVLSARSGAPPAPALALVAVLVLLIAAAAVALARRRPSARSDEADVAQDRDAILRSIALLDKAKEDGNLEAAEWARKRASLKAELIDLDERSK